MPSDAPALGGAVDVGASLTAPPPIPRTPALARVPCARPTASVKLPEGGPRQSRMTALPCHASRVHALRPPHLLLLLQLAHAGLLALGDVHLLLQLDLLLGALDHLEAHLLRGDVARRALGQPAPGRHDQQVLAVVQDVHLVLDVRLLLEQLRLHSVQLRHSDAQRGHDREGPSRGPGAAALQVGRGVISGVLSGREGFVLHRSDVVAHAPGRH